MTDVTGPLARASMNQATMKRADLSTALAATSAAGIPAIGLWREPVAEVGLETAARMVADSGLRVSTLCRAGFFTGATAGAPWAGMLDDNRRAIEETATLAAAGAPGSKPILVLVAGGLPGDSKDLVGARQRVRDAIGELAADAASAGVRLAIEPLHPMYCSDRAVVSTLGQALDLAADFDQTVAVTVDTFHIWWDPDVIGQIERAARERRIATYQVCDWKTPLPADVLLARHFPGDGVIDFGPLTAAVEAGGYAGDVEVEIFNAAIWARPADEIARRTAASFASVVAPHLRSHPRPGPPHGHR